jgi:hypothetical protein
VQVESLVLDGAFVPRSLGRRGDVVPAGVGDIAQRRHRATLHREEGARVEGRLRGRLLRAVCSERPATGSTACRTRRASRRSRCCSFPRGALVHFAVSNAEVRMVTRLEGPPTEFLPFNQGDDGGAGKRPNPTGGHRTA